MKIDNLESKKKFFATLNERQQRHFAALEAKQLGHGGLTKVSEAFGIHRETISSAISEIENSENLVSDRIRKEGAGRKKNNR